MKKIFICLAILAMSNAGFSQIIQSCASGGNSTAIIDQGLVQTGPNTFLYTFSKTPNGQRAVKIVVRSSVTNAIVYQSAPQNYQGPGPFTINFSPTPATPLNQMILTVGIANNNQFTTATANAQNPGTAGCNLTVLPVKLSAFSLKNAANSILVNWSTTMEMNFAGFEVQRQVNGVFTKVGYVLSNNVFTGSSYQFVDDVRLNGTLYYRLKMIDTDGKFSYSDIKRISSNTVSSVMIYPNPSRGEVSISTSEAGVIFDGSMWTVTGRQMASFRINNNEPFKLTGIDACLLYTSPSPRD